MALPPRKAAVAKRPAGKMPRMKAAMKKPAKKVSIIAKGKRARSIVFKGRKEKTYTGLTKAQLMKNRTGKLVTKKMHALGKRCYARISNWTKACQQAKKEMGIEGFCLVGGSSQAGKTLYAKAKAIYTAMQ
eukprot:CAMPEP_0171103940 /NCGR_PEP_ID=MMETSP0766_2-20121228/59706_1 /TAXON_ID=439317 /ORGANISM="Gambierdiscus australes, Strain CAWD 149" /LENGTH=130 /DNA_ID=CAMNT_0011564461 /DNA_START=35 /DNA_END=427 /DNA_ORIENTATION=+